jgi:hypothetical protein
VPWWKELSEALTTDPKPEREKELCAGSGRCARPSFLAVKSESETDQTRGSNKIGENRNWQLRSSENQNRQLNKTQDAKFNFSLKLNKITPNL